LKPNFTLGTWLLEAPKVNEKIGVLDRGSNAATGGREPIMAAPDRQTAKRPSKLAGPCRARQESLRAGEIR
jgi:hypothetical protein